MAGYDPKRPRRSAPADDAPAPIEALIGTENPSETDLPETIHTKAPRPKPEAVPSPPEAVPTPPAMDAPAVDAEGSSTVKVVVAAAAISAVLALVLLVLRRRSR